jgi:gliding motility-associated-like protein
MYFLMRTIGIFIGCFLFKACGSQNLVPNPSFENYSSCPIANGNIYLAVPWSDPSSGSADFYNVCSSNIQSSVPINSNGYRGPRTGDGYAGIVTYVSTIVNAREYIEVELKDSLIPGTKYCIGYYVSLSKSSEYAVNGMSAFLSNTKISCPGCFLTYLPQINYLGNVISDTLNWVLISGNFVSRGGEKFITIGNFNNDLGINTQFVNPGGVAGPEAYYYIDDVYVGTCDTIKPPIQVSTLSIPNVFTPNNDQVNDVFRFTSTNIQTMNCQIYDRWGIKVWELTTPFESWDGHNKTGVVCSDGVYYYLLKATGTDGKEYNKTGFIQLIR